MLKSMWISILSLLLMIILAGSVTADIPVVINELMASNNSCIQDSQGQYDDWIELYNYGTTSVNIGGMYLTDNLSTPTKWQIPSSTIIPAGGYLLIWADDDTSDDGLHANFKLDADGEEVGLFDSNGITLIDSIIFTDQKTDVSFGRIPDAGNDWYYFSSASPGNKNERGFTGIVTDTKFSPDRGFYDASFYVIITTETTGATIRYTTDGSKPTQTNGQVYTGPVLISTTTCLRAAAFKTDWLPTNVDTHTYIFLDDVITQTQQQALNAGYPESWSGYQADYEMDPEVYNDPDYSDQMTDALLSIPTLSIVTDKELLFDPSTGIYTNPLAEGDNLEWERPASAELFSYDDSMEFQINCGLRLQGGHSRHPYKCPKHSFSLRFRGIYGPTTLDYPLFGEDWPVKSFDSIQFRGFFNNAWTHWGPEQRERAQYTHDQWARDAMTEMGHQDALQGFTVHLYLNGMYWGIYNLHERPDADHYAVYNGGNADQIDAINGDPDYVISDPLNTGSISDGTIDAWHNLKSVVAGRDWDEICRILDVDNFIDWTILNYFEGNTDIKRGTNWRAAGGGPQRMPWRFYSWDAEHIFENLGQTYIGEADPTTLFNYLDDIEEFNVRVGDRIHKHLFNNGALTTERNLARWIKLSEGVQLAVIAESARWGDYRRDVHSYQSGPYYLYTKNEFWIPENNFVINQYLPYRTNFALNSIFRSSGMYPNVDAPVFYINGFYQHGGAVLKDDSLTMTSTIGTIFYTLDGTDPRLPEESQDVTDSSILVTEDATKRVLVPSGSISNDWKGAQPFDDSSWMTCEGSPGGVGYERSSGYQNMISLDVEDLMYGSNTSCYIRIPFNITDDLSQFDIMTLKVRYDDGFIAYLNGIELARRNFTGTPAWNSNANASHDDPMAENFEYIDVSSYFDFLQSGNNILAIHGLNTSSTSSDFLISIELEISQSTSGNEPGILPGVHEYSGPVTLTESVHVKSRVKSGNTWSALNEATYAVGPVSDNLRITEIMYNPAPSIDSNDPNEEFIELTNIGSETINLSLVKFTNGIDFTFPSLELAPDEFIVVVEDVNAFENLYGTEVNIAGQFTGRLANNGERIRLEDAIGRTILDFSYQDDWYDDTDGQGYSLTVKNPSNPNLQSWSDKSAWRSSDIIYGSPGWDGSN